MFTYFTKDPNCQVFRMTNTTRPDAKSDFCIPPMKQHVLPNSESSLQGTKILNLDDESRHDCRNAQTVQDGYTKWLQSYPTKQKAHKRHHLVCGDLCLQSNSQEGSSQTTQRSSSELLRTFNANTPDRSEAEGIAEKKFSHE